MVDASLCGAMLSDSTNHILVRSRQNKHVTASHPGLTFDAKDFRALIVQWIVALWKQLCLSQISGDTERKTLHDEFGFIPPAAQCYFFSAFACRPVHIISYFSASV